jgi:hypothetical protein
VFAENPRSQQAAIVYGAWREAADTNKINWPVPVLLVRLPANHTVSSKFWEKKRKKPKLELGTGLQQSRPQTQLYSFWFFFERIKKNSRIFFWLVGWFYSG